MGQLRKFKVVGGEVTLIPHGRFEEGRGCYLCLSDSCLKKAISKNLFSRALKSPVSAPVVEIDYTKEG